MLQRVVSNALSVAAPFRQQGSATSFYKKASASADTVHVLPGWPIQAAVPFIHGLLGVMAT